MSYKYSVILCTLSSDGADVWETPREILETIAKFRTPDLPFEIGCFS